MVTLHERSETHVDFLDKPMRWRWFLPLLALVIFLGWWLSPGRGLNG